MKKLLVLIPALALIACGCKTTSPQLTVALVRTAVSTSVLLGTQKDPGAIPYLKAARTVVCSTAHGTNFSPAQVVSDLEGAGISATKTPTAVIIINSAISLYSAVYDQVGVSTNSQPYLEGVCLGLGDGLGPALPAGHAHDRRTANVPHVQ